MTTFDQHSVFAFSKIVNVVSQSSNTLVIDITPGDGHLFAHPQQVTIATLTQNAPFPFMGNAMIARLTGIATDRLTIDYSSGNREGTNVHTVVVGDYISNSITPKALTDIEAATGGGGGGSTWTKIIKDFTDFSITSTTSTIDITTIKKNAVLKQVLVFVNTIFNDGLDNAPGIEGVGVTGTNYAFYNNIGGGLITIFNGIGQYLGVAGNGVVYSLIAEVNTSLGFGGAKVFDVTSSSNISLTLTAVSSVNFDTYIQGEITIYIETDTLPS